MKLVEAVRTANTPLAPDASPQALSLVCGFTPLHFETFLAAYGRLRLPPGGLSITTGLYGDFPGNLERAIALPASETIVVLEWPDLDPRLGLRSVGGWGSDAQEDIVDTAERSLSRLITPLGRLAKRGAVALCTPTLPLPPLGHAALAHADRLELHLKRSVDCFELTCSEFNGIRILNQQYLNELSPWAARLDPGLELASGFPYSVSHTDALARLLIDLLYPPSPKKGLITDLDDTLWRGILGEVGVDGVGWDLASHAQIHGLYQQVLGAVSRGNKAFREFVSEFMEIGPEASTLRLSRKQCEEMVQELRYTVEEVTQ